MAADVTETAASPAAALVFQHAQHGRVARALEMIDKVVDARREPVGLDLHSCELRPQRRQAFAEALAEMLEARMS